MIKADEIQYFNELASNWDEHISLNEETISTILDKAGIVEGSRVLDVATGTGVLIPYYLKRKVESVCGIDISPKMIEIARSKFDDPRVSFVAGDIEELEPRDEFDACMVFNASPHFDDIRFLTRKLAKWIKLGGRLTIAHSMSLEALNRHHQNVPSSVSKPIPSIDTIVNGFHPMYEVDTIISNEEMIIVSGTLKRKNYALRPPIRKVLYHR